MRVLHITLICILLASAAVASKTKAPAAKPEPPEKTEPSKKGQKVSKTAKKIKHAGIGAKVTASSSSKQFEGELGPEALVDGDLTTRWASEYSAPQRITIELKKKTAIDKLKLHWEAAFATKYHVMVSDDGEGWTPAHYFFRMGEKKDAHVDTCNLKKVETKYILIELTERVNPEWGFSLYEIEVIEAPAAE